MKKLIMVSAILTIIGMAAAATLFYKINESENRYIIIFNKESNIYNNKQEKEKLMENYNGVIVKRTFSGSLVVDIKETGKLKQDENVIFICEFDYKKQIDTYFSDPMVSMGFSRPKSKAIACKEEYDAYYKTN